MNVCADTITSSPGPMPDAFRASVNAAVPDATPTQRATPHAAANSCSKRSTSSPRTNVLCRVTRSYAAVSSRSIAPCWRSSAMNGTRAVATGAMSSSGPISVPSFGETECSSQWTAWTVGVHVS